MNLKRTRYQHGSLTTEARKTSPAVWVYRWRDTDTTGTRKKRKLIVGTKEQFPTKASAIKQVHLLGLEINGESPAKALEQTLAELVHHYRQFELSGDSGKSRRTIAVYEQHIRQYILPKWGHLQLTLLKPVAVEAWLKTLPGAPATKAKTRNILSSIFQHARRHEFTTTNPISLVRQSARRVQEPEVLTPEEIQSLLEELNEPARTIVYIAATTGMRRSEIFSLKWEDVDANRGQLRIVRSIVDQTIGETKTAASRRPLPLPPEVTAALQKWRASTPYAAEADWVFASPQSLGQLPYGPNALLVRHVVPAAKRVGIIKKIGWHTFRRTFATLLQSSGAGIKVTQELLRHSSPVMTLGTYAQAVTSDKREAQSKVASLFVPTPSGV